MALPTPPTLASLVDGQKQLIYDLPGHHDWDGLGCSFHRGRVMIRQGNSDVQTPDAGYQTGCDACVATTRATLDYMNQLYLEAQRGGA